MFCPAAMIDRPNHWPCAYNPSSKPSLVLDREAKDREHDNPAGRWYSHCRQRSTGNVVIVTDDERDARIDTLIDAIADTNRNVATLATDLSSLTRLVRLHLIHDHGYEEPDDE